MPLRTITRFSIIAAISALPLASAAGSRYDGNWLTKLACEAHGQNPGYKWEFPATITDGNFHAQHGEPDGPGYLLIEGKIGDDGNSKLSAKGKVVTRQNAHGVFAMKGDNYSYNIKAHFDETKGSGTRDEGAGILGRPCTFDFEKQPDTPAATPAPPATPPPASDSSTH
jgi:hypothetical protein